MKAAVIEELGRMVVRDVSKPVLTPESLLVRVESCAICGSDLRIFKKGDRRAKLPQIIGHEIAGIVEEVGGDVTGFSRGDRVCIAPGHGCGQCYYCRRGEGNVCINPVPSIGYASQGGFAQYIVPPMTVVRNGFVNRIPDSIATFDEASLSELLACCINGQEKAAVDKDDVVVVVGAGPAGCMHVELARARGAARVILAQRSARRLEMARRFAPDRLVCTAAEDLRAIVLEETGGRGADVVIIACPSREAQEQGFALLAPHGRINFYGGLPHDDSRITVDANQIHYREYFVSGASSSLGRQNRQALDLIASGKIRAREYITHRLPLERIDEAFDIVERKEGIKVVIHPWEDA